jgi:hypothetical protein
MKKENCWEFFECGREKNGIRAKELGICPAATGQNGLNGGNRGRICWSISGTFCRGVRQGTYAQKTKSCMKCDFFKAVNGDEGKDFTLLPG